MNSIETRSAVAAGILGLVVAGAALSSRGPVVERVAECEVTVAEAVPVREEPVQVQLRHSAELGDTPVAALPDDSGVTVESLERNGEDEPNTLRLTVNTAGATAGEWPITVTDGTTECRGTLAVADVDTDEDGR